MSEKSLEICGMAIKMNQNRWAVKGNQRYANKSKQDVIQCFIHY